MKFIKEFAKIQENKKTHTIGFKFYGMWISNPFVDSHGKELTFLEAVCKYGYENIYKYCCTVFKIVDSVKILKIKSWQVRFKYKDKVYLLHTGGELYEEYTALFEIEDGKIKRDISFIGDDLISPCERLFERWTHGQTYAGIDKEKFILKVEQMFLFF